MLDNDLVYYGVFTNHHLMNKRFKMDPDMYITLSTYLYYNVDLYYDIYGWIYTTIPGYLYSCIGKVNL